MKNVACQNRAIDSIVRNSKQAEDTAYLLRNPNNARRLMAALRGLKCKKI